MGRKRILPEWFSKMKIRKDKKKYQHITADEVEQMVKLREAGLSFQQIADILGRARLTIQYHLNGAEFRERVNAGSRAYNKMWYQRNKQWKRDYYEKKKEMYYKGELE